jgi:prophage maintenance system killer protein
MYELVNAKDIIAINQMFDKGHVVNKGSLNFAVATANQERSWLKSIAILVRAVLIDHVFEEGNKRTAAAIIMATFERQGLAYDRDRVARGITLILRKNTASIEKIQQVIKDAIKA